jgi:hypothetical protein
LSWFLRRGVGVVEPTENRGRNDFALFGRAALPGNGSVAKRLVAATLVVVGDEFPKDTPQVFFAEDDDMVEALPSERPIDAFDEAVLPSSSPRHSALFRAGTRHFGPTVSVVDGGREFAGQ